MIPERLLSVEALARLHEMIEPEPRQADLMVEKQGTD